MTRYSRRAGLRLESLGETWAAFSPSSGDTLQLNNEAAAVLECLADGPLDPDSIATLIGEASGTDPEQVAAQLDQLWPQLRSLGFVDPA